MVLLSGLKTVKEYERLVIFRQGKLVSEKGSGLQLVIPVIEQAQVVDTRPVTLPIPLMEVTTRDDCTVKVSALCMFQIVDAKKALTKIDNSTKATAQLCEVALRTAASSHDLPHLIAERKQINFMLKSILDRQTKDFGVKVTRIELKEVRIPKDMRKALVRAKMQQLQLNHKPDGDNNHQAVKVTFDHLDILHKQ
jgi:regulator of protease activity HflC (stomatin/prohibitin superfamily)